MSVKGCPITELDTPALIVNREQVEANVRRFAVSVESAGTGARLRPHIKTHKTIEIAKMQLSAGAVGITTAKLSEAEVFAQAGIPDIFVAYPIIGRQKAQHAVRIAQSCHLIVGVESEKGLQDLSAAASEMGATVFVRVEINSGLNRTGVLPEQAEALCRKVLAAPGLQLDGLFTFRGAHFPTADTEDLEVLGRQEGELMVALGERLRQAGIPIQAISVGSTPTSMSAARVPGVTEVRPGTYVFFDRMTTRTGVSTMDEIALTIMATVVSRPAPDIAVIDAGSKTFCGDIVPARAHLEGYAITSDGRGGIVERMNEEHGIVRLFAGFSPQIGDKIRFFPNHVCTTVNLADRIFITQGDMVQDTWTVAARGKLQ